MTTISTKKAPYLFLAGSLMITIVFKIIPILVSLLLSPLQKISYTDYLQCD
jgi:ABC-type sugar transport system permease subunit